MDVLVTNNPMVKTRYSNVLQVDFLDSDLLGVLTYVRDLIHKGHQLLTHPLSGSIKPNESPYKSVLISGEPMTTDLQSVTIIEECIQATQKFTPRQIPEQNLNDLQLVDLSLIRTALG